MRYYWNLGRALRRKHWHSAYALHRGAGTTYPVAKRIYANWQADQPIDRLDTDTLEKLRVAFNLKTPWSLIRCRK